MESTTGLSHLGELPLVSVGLPTYNRAASLEHAIDSVLSQNYANLELVISDNASTDGTQSICERYCKSDGRVRYIRQPMNCGAARNFARVLSESRGELFMFLADDDWIEDGYISACVKYLRQNPDYSLVGGLSRFYDGSEVVHECEPTNLLQSSATNRVLEYYRNVTDNSIFYGMFRRACLDRFALPDKLAGDWILIASIAFMGKIKTIDHIRINRSVDGASKSVVNLACTYPLPTFLKENPWRGDRLQCVYRHSDQFSCIRLSQLLGTSVIGLSSLLDPLPTVSNVVCARHSRRTSIAVACKTISIASFRMARKK